MVRDLGYPIEIIGAPIVREANGLAMSSRNQYLGAEQRAQAGAIHAALQRVREAVLLGSQPLAAIEADARVQLENAGLVPDYVVIRQADDLGEAEEGSREGLIALVAARMGSTRLIDNLLIAA
jgi:pantoate--beta-alanine ligase